MVRLSTDEAYIDITRQVNSIFDEYNCGTDKGWRSWVNSSANSFLGHVVGLDSAGENGGRLWMQCMDGLPQGAQVQDKAHGEGDWLDLGCESREDRMLAIGSVLVIFIFLLCVLCSDTDNPVSGV